MAYQTQLIAVMSDCPLAAKVIAERAHMPYKAIIDALDRMLDAGLVVRQGRKYTSAWALAANFATEPQQAMAALELAWHGCNVKLPNEKSH